jgi:hypothetical protein
MLAKLAVDIEPVYRAKSFALIMTFFANQHIS